MGYARHVGRVGALAFALGVGAAVAGVGVAWAEPTDPGSAPTDGSAPPAGTAPSADAARSAGAAASAGSLASSIGSIGALTSGHSLPGVGGRSSAAPAGGLSPVSLGVVVGFDEYDGFDLVGVDGDR